MALQFLSMGWRLMSTSVDVFILLIVNAKMWGIRSNLAKWSGITASFTAFAPRIESEIFNADEIKSK